MSQPTSPFSGPTGSNHTNPFRVPPPGMTPPTTNSSNVYASQMNSPFYQYGAYPGADQWLVANPAYYYNSWPYPQPPSTPPSMLLQSPPLPPLPSGGQNYNPTQPPLPPLPKQAARIPPPPPPEKASRRGRSVYPRGGRSNSRGGHTRQQSGASTSSSSPATDTNKTPNANGEGEGANSYTVNADNHHQVQIHKKPKRKPMSSRYTRKRTWCREDADKVLELEGEMSSPVPTVFIHFPDPDLNSHMVKGFSPDIESVHFQIPYKARSCFVRLRPGADIKKVCEEISKIPFGTGFLRAEEKRSRPQPKSANADGIDPYTLYVGNLPPHITVSEVKDNFPTATYIDVGFAQKMKYTRYAFIQYATVEEAMEAYKKTMNLIIDKRNLIVRFRRTKGNIALPTDTQMPNPKKSKLDDSECEIISDNLGKSKNPIEARDSKENVLREAAQIMDNTTDKHGNKSIHRPTPRVDGPIVNIKNEKDVDMDDTDFADDCDLLGTQIKDEPFDDFCDDYYPELNDEEDDDIPPEEMYDAAAPADDYSFFNDDHEEPEERNSDNVGPTWEGERKNELEEKDEKPDIKTLPASFDSNEDDMRPSKIRYYDVASKKKDDLDDLFNAMNPESDDDDF